jgi:8-oxo-dGTP pyrophosphatase MutT (NUDIX family)
MTETERCAGIIFVSSRGNALFLKRSDHGDYAGIWGLPGGHLRPSETHKQAARREAREEVGQCPKGQLIEVNRQITEVEGDDQTATRTVDYTTFIQEIDYEFIPQLNKEHDEFLWAPLFDQPQPIHPGLANTIEKMNMDELGIAKLMMQGLTTSPQKYGSFWLFDIRITGTGLSYRAGLDEFVWRDKSLYLNDEFLQRIGGLPVIFEHPKSNTLNTKEYVERNIGAVFIPYIKDSEIWAIIRVYDEFAAKIMSENILSTSPCVVLTGKDPKFSLDNGGVLLVEGKPRLVDHIAVCFRGVWDKGEAPTGVASVTAGDMIMADEDGKAAALEEARRKDAESKAKKDAEDKEKADAKAKSDADAKAKADAEAKAKADADAGQLIDKTLKCMDSVMSRMDEFEKNEKERADRKAAKRADKQAFKDSLKAKRDADEDEDKKKKEEEKEKADQKAKADAEGDMRKRIADVESRLPKQMTDADYASMADAQVGADKVLLMHGKRAPRPLDGESLSGYRRRLAGTLKEFSPTWKDINLSVISDEAAFENIAKTIYADATEAGLHPVIDDADFLREVVDQDVTGRKITKFVGRPSAWMGQFSSNRRRLVGIRNHS